MDQDKLDLRAQEQARKKALRDRALRQADAGKRKNHPTRTSQLASSKPLNRAVEVQPTKKSKKLFSPIKLSLRLPKLRLKPQKPWKKLAVMIAAIPLILVAALIPDILKPTVVSAAINLRGTNSGSNTTGTSVNVAPNAGTKDGDVMIAVLFNGALPGTVTAPGGWTSFGSTCTSGTGEDRTTMRFYWRKYVTTDTNWTWSWTTSGPYHLSITSYSGVDNTNPIHAVPSTFCNTGTGTFLTANNITTTLANTVVVAAFSQGNGNSGTTHVISPSSGTERYGYSGGYNYSCGLLCTNTKQYEYSYSDSTQAASGTTSRTAFSNVSSPFAATNFALTPATDPTLEQSAYRWLANADSVTPGSALAATNTAITAVKLGDVIRLRMLLHVSTAELQVDLVQFKLRFAPKVGGACGGGDETFSDVATASGAIRFYNNTNAGATDGATIATTANDPSHSGHTNIAHTYEEANNFATRILTPSGQDAMWDFALTNDSAPSNTAYCFKVTTSANADINTYTAYPELTTINISYNQAAYRWFDANNSTTPGTALGAGQDTAIAQVNTNADFRLRMLLDNGGTDAIPAAYENLKLQFATRTGATCDTNMGTTDETYADVATASGAIRYRDNAVPADNATAVSATGDPTYLGHTVNLQYYKESNNFTTRISQPASQAGLWDFSLTNNSAAFGTVYCFRVTKADGSTLNTYTTIPQLTIVNPSFEQSAYRWYNNANATTPGTVRAASNTVTTAVAQTAQLRLRLLLHISGDSIFSGTETFKLQFATKTGGSCGDDESFADVVSGSGVIRYLDNASPADAAATSTTANDPSHSGHTIIAQTYEEANNFTSVTTTAAGQDAMWDLALQTVSAPLRTSYCFKVVRSTGSDINTYSAYPELTTLDPRYEQSAFRWLTNADSTTPGAPLASNNTTVTDISQNTIVRLRLLLHLSNDASDVGLENFKLQFAQKSGTCDTAFSGESYTDLVTGSGAFRYYNNSTPADGATIGTTGGDPSHSSDTVVPQTYEEANNFTTVTSTPAGQDAMWDFAVTNISASQNTAWCFRAVKSDGSPLNTYSQVAELSTAPSLLNQAAYRWFQNVNIADMMTITPNPSSGDDVVNDTAIDASGGYLYLVGYDSNGTDRQWRIEKRSMANSELDTNFDGDGVVTDDISASNNDEATAIALDTANGYMYVVGYTGTGATDEDWHIQKRSLSSGALDTSFNTTGRLTATDLTTGNDRPHEVAITSTHMFIAGYDSTQSNRARLEKRSLSSGARDTNFDGDGHVLYDSANSNRIDEYTALALDGTYVYAVGHDQSPGNDNSQWHFEKRAISNGAVDTNFDGDGILQYEPSGNNFTDRAYAIAIDSTYMYVAGVQEDNNNDRRWSIQKRTLAAGVLDANFDGENTGNGNVTTNPSANHDDILDLVIDSNYLYVTGFDACGGGYNGESCGSGASNSFRRWRLEKRSLSNGNRDTGFDGDGVVYVDPITTQDDEGKELVIDTANARIYISGYDQTQGAGNKQWRVEKRKTSDGSKGWEPPTALVSQDTKTTLNSNTKFRLRILAHVSGENMASGGETLKLQVAKKVGTCDSGFVGETYTDVAASGGDVNYYDNTNIADASASVSIEGDPSHSGHTNIPQTYEEANNITLPNAVNAGQDALWDLALIEDAAFDNYCFRLVKSDGSPLGAYSVVPEVAFCDEPKTENLMRHGNFFCDDSKRKFSWS